MTLDAEAVAADLEIRSLVARIAQLADEGELDEYVDCFTVDADWQMPGAPRRGRVEIRAGGEERRAAGQTGPGSNSRHLVSTTSVAVIGDTATAVSYWQFFVNTDRAPALSLIGRYDDDFVRESDRWRLAVRRVTIG